MPHIHSTPKVLLLGAGDRGQTYARWARKTRPGLSIVGVADPDPRKRAAVARLHSAAAESQASDWRDLLDGAPEAAGVIIAMPDRDHVEAAEEAARRGYRVLLEKPMAATLAESRRIAALGARVTVCHVLRYIDLFRRMREIISTGTLGDVTGLVHAENVAYHHFAHSYVRGNWGNAERSSPFVLAKACHDLDLICWFVGKRPVRVSATGELRHFQSSRAPEKAPARCVEGCPVASTCVFEARRTYLHGREIRRALARYGPLPIRGLVALLGPFVGTWSEWPTSTITSDLGRADIERALQDGPYGRCVYRCDNDQPDRVEALIEFEGGTTALFCAHGHSAEEARTIRVDGTLATLKAKFGARCSLEVHPHGEGRVKRYRVKDSAFGHSEGDRGIVEAFAKVLQGDLTASTTDAKESLISHELAFAIEQSRKEGRPIHLLSDL